MVGTREKKVNFRSEPIKNMSISKEEFEKLIGKTVGVYLPFPIPNTFGEPVPVVIKRVGNGWLHLEINHPLFDYKEVLLKSDEIDVVCISKE